ncbi:MAG: MFS transporter [Candidatus Micrarchaeaceae archaeon]
MGSARILAFTSYAHFVNDGFYLLFPLLIAYYSKIPGISVSFLGFIAVIYAVLSGVLSPKIGGIADRKDNDAAMIGIGLSIYAAAVAILVIPFAYHSYLYYIVIIGAAVLGVAQSFYHPIGAAILSYTFKKSAAAKMGINGSAGSFGRSIISGLFVFAVAALGVYTGMFLLALFALISAAIVYFGLSHFKRNGKVANRKTKTKIDNIAKQSKKYRGFLIALMAVVFLRAMFLAGTVTFIPKYLAALLKSNVLMGSVVSISFLFAVAGQLVFGYITDKKGGRFSLVFTSVIPGIAFAIFLLAGNNALVLTASYSVFTFFAFTGFPVLLGYVNQSVPKSISATAGGDVWGVGQYIGNGAGIAVASALTLFVELGSALWLMLLFLIPSIILIAFLPKNGGFESAKLRIDGI